MNKLNIGAYGGGLSSWEISHLFYYFREQGKSKLIVITKVRKFDRNMEKMIKYNLIEL